MNGKIRLQIDTQESFANGVSFGDVGPYERIAGHVFFEIDPDAPENRVIVDLEKTQRNDLGLVGYSTDFFILRPEKLARGNQRLLYDVNNRGNKRILQYFNDGVHSNNPSESEHAGNGFLMRRGYSIVWSGWQGDLRPGDGRLTLQLPRTYDHGS